MHPRQKESAAYVKQLIETGPLPRNQISAISGLTNTYIRDLEHGTIANVERGKIIALALALNLNLLQLDEMLKLFDRAPLSTDDIPLFIAISNRTKSTSVLLPVRNPFSFDIYTIAAIAEPGKHAIASYKPTAALHPKGYWIHANRKRLDEHPIYGELVEALGNEMSIRLEVHLQNHPVEQFVSLHAINEYLKEDLEPEQRKWHVRHVRRLIDWLERFENLKFYLTEESSSFLFSLKTTPVESKSNDRLLISYPTPPGPKMKNVGLLAGFTTSNQVVIANFKEELSILKRLIIEDYSEKTKLIDYLEGLIRTK